MRTIVSIITVLGLIVAFWAAILTTDAQSARQPGPVTRAPSPRAEPVVTDADRRARLEARIVNWTRTDRKPVLQDGARHSAVPVRTRAERQQPVSRTDGNGSGGSARPEPALPFEPQPSGTIAPPPTTSSFERTSGARGYRAPRLDLVTMPRVPADPIECLTQAIYYEARNESEEGQAAVAEVVINRSRAGNYPRDICKVVYQRNSRTCQFTFTCDGSIGRGAINRTAWSRAERIAREVHAGRSGLLPRTSVNYHANYVRPTWGQRLERVRQIGAHIFYGAAKPGHATPGSLERRPEPAPSTGLQFVRIEALDRAFAQATSGEAQTPIPQSTTPAGP
ncbi:cell wall hydrolase [Brevundimonas variabilis]|uniref:Spore germination cell wall hydrolase CwlJ-like protein n=1 Tax=Brevundimonas variabilis TaxID=74312 RepID=A0A7W9CH07_9CAUL|nr:cell wall hydrolase [Brevundimonas variabilis]MBB5745336.1 spore germination cell wall hydrolase CwlJ-like protein [Brevundimonas variabilis]